MACLNANFFCAKGALLTLTSFASHHLTSTSLFRDGQRLSDAQTSNNSEHISSGRLVWCGTLMVKAFFVNQLLLKSKDIDKRRCVRAVVEF